MDYRCFVNDLSAANSKFYQFAVDAGGTRLDIGEGRNVAWNGKSINKKRREK